MCTFFYLTGESSIHHSPKVILEALDTNAQGQVWSGDVFVSPVGPFSGLASSFPLFHLSAFPELCRDTFSLFKTHSQCFYVGVKPERLQSVQ